MDENVREAVEAYWMERLKKTIEAESFQEGFARGVAVTEQWYFTQEEKGETQ